MDKFYDTEKSNRFFEEIDAAAIKYAEAVQSVQGAYAAFIEDEGQVGEQAEAVKELVSIGETTLLDGMLDIQRQIREAGTNIRESFALDVDAAENAYIETNTLEQITDDFKQSHRLFDEIGMEIEEIAAVLQSRFGKYASFETPDFEMGREAYEIFCGGSGNNGFVKECIQKLLDFDMESTAMLEGLELREQLATLTKRIRQSSSVMHGFQPQAMVPERDIEKTNIHAGELIESTEGRDRSDVVQDKEALKREVERLGRKIKSEGDSENVFDIDPETVDATDATNKVSVWDVDPSAFEQKERPRLDERCDYFAQMSKEQQQCAEKMYEQYRQTKGKIENERSANYVANLMARHYRVIGDTAREAEALRLQTRTAGMSTAAATGTVDALLTPLDSVAAASYAVTGQKGFVETWKEMRSAHDFSDIRIQHPIAHMGGEAIGNILTYQAFNAALGSIPKVASVTNKAGNVIAGKAARAVPGKAGQLVKGAGDAIGNIIQGTIPDIALDTLPTELSNISDGMKPGEVVLDTGKNIGANVLLNTLGEATPTVLKKLGERLMMGAVDDVAKKARTPILGQEYYDDFCSRYGAENVEWVSERARVDKWEQPPKDELFRKYKYIYENDLYFNQDTGRPNWPSNDGFLDGSVYEKTLSKGTVFMRYGESNGEYLGNAIDEFEARSLAPFSRDADKHYYRLVEDFTFTTGEVAPWFGMPGGGEQFIILSPSGDKYSIDYMLEQGIIEEIFHD